METDFICMHYGSRKEPIFTKMYNMNDKKRRFYDELNKVDSRMTVMDF